MTKSIQLLTTIGVNDDGDEYYEVSPNVDLLVRLSEITIRVFHPLEGDEYGMMVIEKKVPQTLVHPGGSPQKLFIEELLRAEERFADGYINFRFFVRHWKSSGLPRDTEARQSIADGLIADGLIELYTTLTDGKEAVRVTPAGRLLT